MDCIFCKILNSEIPSKKVYEDEFVYAFHDINPMAPVHIIVIPKVHIESANKIDKTNSNYVAKIFEVIPKTPLFSTSDCPSTLTPGSGAKSHLPAISGANTESVL